MIDGYRWCDGRQRRLCIPWRKALVFLSIAVTTAKNPLVCPSFLLNWLTEVATYVVPGVNDFYICTAMMQCNVSQIGFFAWN
jgi:hypothetical protein